jgi:hypothetical protein
MFGGGRGGRRANGDKNKDRDSDEEDDRNPLMLDTRDQQDAVLDDMNRSSQRCRASVSADHCS